MFVGNIGKESGAIYMTQNDTLIFRKKQWLTKEKLHKFKYDWDKKYSWFSNIVSLIPLEKIVPEKEW